MQYTQARPFGPMGSNKARRLLIAEYGNLCFRCFHVPGASDDVLDVDHIVPHALGGHHVYENYQLLCDSCNTPKGLIVADYRPGTRSMDVTTLRPFIQPWARSRLPKRERKLLVKRLRPLKRIDGRYEWVSAAEASQRLGVSVSTIRRMIEAGSLVGERETIGGARDRFLIRFDRSETPQDASPFESDDESDDASDPSTEPSVVTTRLLDTVLTQAEQIAALRERVGRSEAARAAAERRAAELAERLRAAEDRLARRWYDPRTW